MGDADDERARENASTGDRDTIDVRTGPTDRREVVVPLRLYKTITVFSTMLAILFVVLGFTFFDAATWQGGIIVSLLRIPFPGLVLSDTLRTGFGALGVLSIALGAIVYILGARFRTAGMGNGKTEADKADDNG